MPGEIYSGGIYVSVSTLPIVTVRSSELSADLYEGSEEL